MSRPAELFAIAAIGHLILGLFSRFLLPTQALFFAFRSFLFVLSPGRSTCIFLGALLGASAAVYAFRILPMNQRAGLWHFWLTATGIVLFWSGFYLFLKYHPSGGLHDRKLAVATIGWLTSFPLILGAQGIFVVNMVAGIIKLRHHGQ